MSKLRKLLSLILWSCVCLTVVSGQATIPATGGNASGSGGSVSYTVGQILYNSVSGSNGSIVQGVQQPYEISVVTAIANTEDIDLKCMVFPNPTYGQAKLVIELNDFEGVSFRLYDISGAILQVSKVESKETELSLLNQSAGIYFLHVIKNKLEVKVFKIIKK
jgi:hypothetical protein